MNADQVSSLNMMIRSAKVLKDHNAVLDASAQALVPQLDTNITTIEALRKGQVEGKGQFHGGATERRVIAKQLRQALLDIAQTAQILAKGPKPGLDDQLRVPNTRQYSALLGAGDAFVAVLTPPTMKALFTARGFDATFVEDLSAVVESFQVATDRKFGGVNGHIGSTRGLVAAIRDGVGTVRDLDAILAPKLRKANPVVYGAWKAAIHIGNSRRKIKGPRPALAKASAQVAEEPVGGGTGDVAGGSATGVEMTAPAPAIATA